MLRSDEPRAYSALIRPFYPALDGLRAIAFLLVFMTHYGPTAQTDAFYWGWVGVDLFFVLSGFLITGILFDSLHKPDYFRNFYTRRALRIFPLFYGFFLVMALITPLLKVDWTVYSLTNLVYLSNFFEHGAALGLHPSPFIFHYTMPHGLKSHSIVFGHFWTLCVEEQFYMLWPAVVWLVRSRRSLINTCLAIIVVLPVVRSAVYFYLPQFALHGGMNEMSFLRMDTLLMGAALALWLRNDSISIAGLLKAARYALVVAPTLLIAALWLENAHIESTVSDSVVGTIGFSLIAVTATAILVLALDMGSRFTRALCYPRLSSLGRISYGLYVYHLLPLAFFTLLGIKLAPHHLAFLVPIAGFICTWIVAHLSYRYYEAPFLRLKDKLAKQSKSGTVLPPISDQAEAE